MARSTGQVVKKTGFLDLPGELRNRIYLYHVKGSTGFVSVKIYRICYQMVLPLLNVDNQIANEVRPLLFAENGVHLVPQHLRRPITADRASWHLIDPPPVKFRPLIKYAKLTLFVPRCLRHNSNSDDGSVIIDGPGRICLDSRNSDWLEPLLTFTSLGFSRNELVIEVDHAGDTYLVVKKDEDRNSRNYIKDINLLKLWIKKDIESVTPEGITNQVIFKEGCGS